MVQQYISESSKILGRLKFGEDEDLEFKSAQGGLPKSLWETYSAMANTRGGIILLGVENDGSVTGIKDLISIKTNFWNTINNRGKVNINLLDSNDIEEIRHENGVVLAVYIPRALRYQKPVFIGQNPLSGTYRRNSEGDYHCTEQEVRRMLSDSSEESADSRILEKFTLDDLDDITLKQYRHRFASFKPAHPWLSEDDKGLLCKLGGWRECRNTKIQGLTVAGLLMFGKEESLREALPQYHVDYREKLSDDPMLRWTDRLTVDGTWPGNLFQFYVRVIQRLSVDLKLPFQLDDELFRKGESIVHIAIREALVNALIHADFQGMGGVVIEKYRNRFEFSNPGTLLISLDNLMNSNVSECRNKSLQTMFTLIGAAEKAGSGVDKIRMGWNSQHWRPPIVREQMQPDRVLWMLPMASLIPKESLDRLKKKFGKKFSKFNQLEIQAVVTADIEGHVDNVRMRQITEGHAADITQLLQELTAKGILRQEGYGRWTRYYLPLVLDSMHEDSDWLHKGNDWLHKGNNWLHKGNDWLHKGNDWLHKGNDCAHRAEISDQEWEVLQEIAQPSKQNKRLSPEQMEEIILELCKQCWLTRRQLADLLDRNPYGLRSRYLTQMVSHKLLRLRHPDKPNRVDQAYTAVMESEARNQPGNT